VIVRRHARMVATMWSAEARDDEDRPMRGKGSVRSTAAIESTATLDKETVPSAFAQRVSGAKPHALLHRGRTYWHPW